MGILNLFLLRHGEAGSRTPISGKDAERALTVAGRKELEEIAASITTMGIKFDKIATSPLKRAYETAAIVAKILKSLDHMEEWDELKPEGDRFDLYRRLSKMRDADILLVGHEPYFSTMIGEIVSGNSGSHISLKKAGLAKLRINSLIPRPSGELRWLLTPKQIRKMS